MNISQSISSVLTHPSPESLWQLRGDLLAAELPLNSPVWGILDRFYEFLSSLSASADAHEYSKLASLMDIGAVGGVALENVIQSGSGVEMWKKLLAGGISEGLMVMASRQYIKAFRAEMATVYQSAVWFLYGALWQLSARLQPELNPTARRQYIESLMTAVHDDVVAETIKIALLGRLFQILLLVHLSIKE